jgi:hypothetical protein
MRRPNDRGRQPAHVAVGGQELRLVREAVMNVSRSAVVLFVICGAVTAFAQTTGYIEGSCAGGDDVPLPGVTVEISSPSMQGTRVDVTDADGRFRFPAIPPGEYSLTAALAGFGTVHHQDIDVDLDRTVKLKVVLPPPAFEDVVEVTGEAPVVDVTSTELGTNFDQQELTSMPLGRNFTSAVNLLGGVQYENADTDGFSIYGSTGAENNYVIDGVDSTGVRYGVQGKTINMEFVEEVQVKTGGYDAEYGRALGGVVNVITKSGGNDFHGDVFAYYHSDDTQAKFAGTGSEDLVTAAQAFTSLTRQDYGLDLGGYMLRDRLWFFVAYDRVKREQRELTNELVQLIYDAPREAVSTSNQDLRSFKLTWNISPAHTLIGSLFGDPEQGEGANDRTIQGPKETYWNSQKTGGDDYTFKYLGLPTGDLLVNLQAGHHQEEDSIDPLNSTDVRTCDYRSRPVFCEGGIGGFSENEYTRDEVRADLTWFTEGAGSHELKVGYEFQRLEAFEFRKRSGGQNVNIIPCDPDSPYERADCSLALQDDVGYSYYGHGLEVTQGSTLDDWTASFEGLTRTPTTENHAVYLRDRWRVLPSLTLSLGVRWEEQALMDESGRAWIEIDDNWAPRLGLVWDISNDGRSKLFASYGRFFESIPMDLNVRFMTAWASAGFYNTDPVDITPDHDLRPGRISDKPSIVQWLEDLFATAVDPDMEGQSIDEWIVGYEINPLRNWTFGISGVFRELHRVLEDSSGVIDGEWIFIVGNPGEGLLAESWTIPTRDPSGPSYPDPVNPGSGWYFHGPYPNPEPKRDYTAVQLTARKRYRDNWALYASYVWSQLEGNYDGLYQRSSGQLDPNINSGYDYIDFMYVVDPDNPFTTPVDGPLSNDRSHQVKVSGFYDFDFGLQVGATAYWQSGRPLSTQGWSDWYWNNDLWLTQRGALGRMDDEYELDLHFGYPFEAGPVTITASLDIFNVLNRQAATDRDMGWSIFYEDAVVDGSIPGCEQWGGSLYDPAIPDHCAPNPDYMKGTDWQHPRFVRLGLKVSF